MPVRVTNHISTFIVDRVLTCNNVRAGRRLFGHSLRDTYAAFRAFDRDGSGLLSEEEFR